MGEAGRGTWCKHLGLVSRKAVASRAQTFSATVLQENALVDCGHLQPVVYLHLRLAISADRLELMQVSVDAFRHRGGRVSRRPW